MTDWQTYYNQHLSRPPRPILVKAISFCKNKDRALDIGAGTLVESKCLLDSRFNKVVAIDSSPEIKNFAKGIKDERLEVHVIPFQDLVVSSEEYDLISAQYALPFYGPKGFEEFIAKLIFSLKKEGVFVGQFFGERDGWNNGKKNMTFQTKEEAQELLKGLNLVEFTEEEKDGKVASGEDKHWHVFHFIAVK
jgi:tellurite methyltransferase